jgi:tetratricopeptide (TPR) repeat protein
MEYHTFLFPLTVLITALLCRLPFTYFPLDDDFSIYTYRAHFAKLGFKWKKDIQLIGNPFWKMPILDFLYGNSEGGVRRLRMLQTIFHMLSAVTVYYVTWSLTQNSAAALTAGLLYAFYGTSPDLIAGSFNFEQFYIPFILAALGLIESGPESIFSAGLCFGLASIAKVTTLIYVPAVLLTVAITYGSKVTLIMLLGAVIPILVSLLIDWKLGYMDPISRKQNNTRLATTLRLVKTKKMYFSIMREVWLITKQTLPVWVFGLPALILTIISNNHPFLLTFIAVTVAMMIAQRTFSRYHYLPWIALLSVTSGLGLDWALSKDLIAWVLGSLFVFSLAWNLESLAPYYLLPLKHNTLARYEKFDQYLYLPHLGKQLKRLTRLKNESSQRIYVWGTFSQIYQLAGLPASDNYLHYSIGPWDNPALEGFFNSMVGGLLKHRPAYLIKSFDDLDMGILEQITGLRYRLIKVVLARFPVYKLEAITSIPINPIALSFLEKMNLMKSLTSDRRHAPGVNREDFLQGRINTATAQCKKLLKLNPQDVDGWDYMGEIYASLNKTNEAASCYQRVLKIAPYRSENRLSLAIQLIKLNQLDEAKALVKEEIKKFGYNSETFYLLTKINIEQNNYLEAINALDLIKTQPPKTINCWEWTIDALGKLKDTSRLKNLCKNTGTIKLISDREWVRTRLVTQLASLESQQRPKHETINYFLKNEPENRLLHYALASELEQAGHLGSAIEKFKQVASNRKNYPHVQANAWFRLARLTSHPQREKYLKNCLELASDHVGAKKLLLETKNTKPSGAQLI